MLPALLPGLSRLRVLRLPVDDTYEDWPPLDFSHMKQLQELINADSYQNCSCFSEVHFPVQLQRLHFGVCTTRISLTQWGSCSSYRA